MKTAYIPLFLLDNGFVVCGPSAHETEACAESAQPILKPFAIVPVEVPEATADTPRVSLEYWSAAARAQISSQVIGFLQFKAPPREQREANAAAAASAGLWCLHIIGPDDVHAAPSKAHAQRAADRFNDHFEGVANGVLCRAVVEPWPHSPESHAETVERFCSEWLMPTRAAEA